MEGVDLVFHRAGKGNPPKDYDLKTSIFKTKLINNIGNGMRATLYILPTSKAKQGRRIDNLMLINSTT